MLGTTQSNKRDSARVFAVVLVLGLLILSSIPLTSGFGSDEYDPSEMPSAIDDMSAGARSPFLSDLCTQVGDALGIAQESFVGFGHSLYHLLGFKDKQPVLTASTLDTHTWDGGAWPDHKASTAANWNANTLPEAADSIIFDGTNTSSCTQDLALALGTFTLAGKSVV